MCDNKWQGIAPTGKKRASVVRSVQRRGWGNNYTKVFCFNAIGGVGAKSLCLQVLLELLEIARE